MAKGKSKGVNASSDYRKRVKKSLERMGQSKRQVRQNITHMLPISGLRGPKRKR